MKRNIIIIIASVAIIWVSVLTVALTKSNNKIDSAKADLTRAIFYDARELDDALHELVSWSEGESDSTAAQITERIQVSLGKLETAFNSALILCDSKISHSMFGEVDFISNCLSARYSVIINDNEFSGILYDEKLTANELEYIKRLQVELDALREPMLLGDGLNLSPDVTLDDILPLFIELVEKFTLRDDSDSAAFLLFED